MAHGTIMRLDAADFGQSGSETILVVEDEDSVRAIVRLALEKSGFTVFAASCGADAIALCDTRIDLLITDIIMPRMNGRQVVDSLRRQHPHLKVLFMSGQQDFMFPSDAFLQKPFTPRVLTEKVRQVLGAKR